MKQSKIEEVRQPKSMCTCGHTGDGYSSEHASVKIGALGHGRCLRCHCKQFTWSKWLPWFEAVLKGK